MLAGQMGTVCEKWSDYLYPHLLDPRYLVLVYTKWQSDRCGVFSVREHSPLARHCQLDDTMCMVSQ